MGKVIGLINHKGGSGKTTTALNLAGMLGKYPLPEPKKNFRVLLIDLDPQGQANRVIATGAAPIRRTLDEILVATPLGAEAIELSVMPSLWKNVFHVPSNADRMSEVSETIAKRFMTHPIVVVDTIIRKVAPLFDFIILDTGPSMGLINWNAIYASDMIIIPSLMNGEDLHEVHQTLQNIKRIATEHQHRPSFIGILPTVYRRQAKSQELYAEALKTSYPTIRVFEPIPENNALQEARDAKLDILEYDRTAIAMGPYARLVEEVVNGAKE